MKRLFLALFLLGAIHSAHASPLPTLDMDELLFSSDEVVEGPIVATYKRNYDLEADVRVEKTWMGRDLSGYMITVDDLVLYSKNLSAERRDSLGKGDRAIFFLHDVKAHRFMSLNPRSARYEVKFSGVRLIRLNRVSGFTQNSDPGGYDELPSVSRAVFDAGFAASRARVADLKTHLRASVSVQDKPYFVRWKVLHMQRMGLVERTFFGDTLSQALDERLRQITRLTPRHAPIP